MPVLFPGYIHSFLTLLILPSHKHQLQRPDQSPREHRLAPGFELGLPSLKQLGPAWPNPEATEIQTWLSKAS